MNKKIFFFVDVYGVATQPYVPRLIEVLREKGVDITAISVTKPKKKDNETIYLKQFPSLYSLLWAIVYYFKNRSFYKNKGCFKSLIRRIAEQRRLLSNKKSIVHIYHSQKTPYISAICDPSKYDYYITFHGFDTFVRPFIDEQWRDELKQIFALAKGLIYVSEPMRQFAVEKLGAPADKCFVSAGGVSVLSMEKLRNEELCRFVTIGRLVWEKGYPYTLLAIKRLVEQTDKKFEYCVIGEGVDYQAIEYLIRGFKLEKYVRLYGFVENQKAKELVNSCDVYLQCSLSEASSLTLKEAGMMGLPLIGTNVGGIPETIIDGYTGSLVELGDIDAMVSVMYDYLVNPKLRKERGENAKKYCIENFSIDSEADRIIRIYDSMI